MVRGLAALACAFVAICAVAHAADAQSANPRATAAASADASRGDPANAFTEVRRAIKDYRLGADDHVKVTVFGEDSLTGDFAIGSTGTVSMPLIGEVHAAGLTVADLRDAITNDLASGYLKDPKVGVEVSVYRPFFILGEVMKPGTYPYTNDLTVQNAVATAGGYTYRANTKKVFIKREGENEEREYPLNGTVPVAPGDTIRVGERLF